VDEIYKADKKVGYTQEYQIVIIDEITAVPGQDKDTKSDNNTEYLGKCKYQMKSTPYFTRKVHHFI
jgi:hypothetical protein